MSMQMPYDYFVKHDLSQANQQMFNLQTNKKQFLS
jgi:hypothetical protein